MFGEPQVFMRSTAPKPISQRHRCACANRALSVLRWSWSAPLYFFDSRDNDRFIEDDIGLEFPSFEAVKVEAARALAELACEVIPGTSRRELVIEVRDEQGPVLAVTISFEAVLLRA